MNKIKKMPTLIGVCKELHKHIRILNVKRLFIIHQGKSNFLEEK